MQGLQVLHAGGSRRHILTCLGLVTLAAFMLSIVAMHAGLAQRHHVDILPADTAIVNASVVAAQDSGNPHRGDCPFLGPQCAFGFVASPSGTADTATVLPSSPRAAKPPAAFALLAPRNLWSQALPPPPRYSLSVILR